MMVMIMMITVRWNNNDSKRKDSNNHDNVIKVRWQWLDGRMDSWVSEKRTSRPVPTLPLAGRMPQAEFMLAYSATPIPQPIQHQFWQIMTDWHCASKHTHTHTHIHPHTRTYTHTHARTRTHARTTRTALVTIVWRNCATLWCDFGFAAFEAIKLSSTSLEILPSDETLSSARAMIETTHAYTWLQRRMIEPVI